jgi:hypothetical protein
LEKWILFPMTVYSHAIWNLEFKIFPEIGAFHDEEIATVVVLPTDNAMPHDAQW